MEIKYLDEENKIQTKKLPKIGTLNDASRFLIEMVKENPDDLTLLPLEPLTNIATALKHYPEFFDNLKKNCNNRRNFKSYYCF